MNFNYTLRLSAFFSGALSNANEIAIQMKNSGHYKLAIAKSVKAFVVEELSRQDTGRLFTAMATFKPQADLTVIEGSLLDFIIDTLASMLTNDVMQFTACNDKDSVPEIYEVNGKYSVQAKTTRKINTAIAMDTSAMTEAQIDELSGKGVVSGVGDNDCTGGACSI